MKKQRLGQNGPAVSRIGLGCMGMSGMYGQSSRDESIRTIHEALDAGVTLLDTGDFYGMGHNELLLKEALSNHHRDQVVLSVKFGAMRAPNGQFVGTDCRPEAVKNFLAYTLNRLGTNYVDIYRPARLDSTVPIEETIGAIKELVDQGYVRHIGLSEVGSETIRRAHSVHAISDLQIEYSLVSRGIEDEILSTVRHLGIGVTAYGVLSRGLLGGKWTGENVREGDIRHRLPRFQGDNLKQNLNLVAALREIAQDKGVSVAQLSIAWVLSRGDDIIPLIGARSTQQLTEALSASEIHLTAEEFMRIESAVPPGSAAGERYAPAQMASLDSERTKS